LLTFDITGTSPLRQELELITAAIQHPSYHILIPVPIDLSIRYLEGLTNNAPPSYTDISNFPLIDGLDALISALDLSTTRVNPLSNGFDMSVENLNYTIKARYIFDCMLRSQGLRATGLNSPWAFAMAGLLKKLGAEYQRWHRELEACTNTVMCLNFVAFQIWSPIDDVLSSKLLSEPDVYEEKILEVPLTDLAGQVNKSMMVFRRPSNELRILTFTSSGGQEIEKTVNLHQAELVPRYALRGSNFSLQGMELCFPGASSGHRYQFRTRDELHTFQQALTGYKVVFEENCLWNLHCSGLMSKSKLKGHGLIQILQPKPLQPVINDNNSVTSFGSSVGRTAKLANIKESKHSIVAEHPKSPVLLILTEVDGQPTFIHIHCKCFL
jgi:hypothetical protein